MRIFSGVVAAALITAAGAVCAGEGAVRYASPQAAFEQGLGAYKAGYYEIAIPALEEAAAKGAELNKFFAVVPIGSRVDQDLSQDLALALVARGTVYASRRGQFHYPNPLGHRKLAVLLGHEGVLCGKSLLQIVRARQVCPGGSDLRRISVHGTPEIPGLTDVMVVRRNVK